MTRPKVPDDKRQRTAQACDSCKRRKQKVGCYPFTRFSTTSWYLQGTVSPPVSSSEKPMLPRLVELSVAGSEPEMYTVGPVLREVSVPVHQTCSPFLFNPHLPIGTNPGLVACRKKGNACLKQARPVGVVLTHLLLLRSTKWQGKWASSLSGTSVCGLLRLGPRKDIVSVYMIWVPGWH